MFDHRDHDRRLLKLQFFFYTLFPLWVGCTKLVCLRKGSKADHVHMKKVSQLEYKDNLLMLLVLFFLLLRVKIGAGSVIVEKKVMQ